MSNGHDDGRAAPAHASRAGAVSVLAVNHATVVWGAQLRLLDMASRLDRRGISVTLASPRGPLSERWFDAGLPLVHLDVPPHRGLRRPDGSGRRATPRTLAGALRRVARSSRAIAGAARPFDVIQSHSLASHVETAVAGRRARRPVVLDLHDIVRPGLGRRLLGVAGRLAGGIVANSRASAATLPPACAHKVSVVHPGVDLDRFSPGDADPEVRKLLADDPNAPLVGILGRVDPRKGVDVVVRAAARLRGDLRATQVVVVGDPAVAAPGYVESLRREAETLLGCRARFVGRLENIPDVLRSLDVLVNASRAEPFGRSLLEAQACGVPVVATDAGGIPEFVDDGVTGLLVPPFEVEALATALVRVLGDADLRRRLAEAGRKQAAERFGIERQADRLAEIYRSLTIGAGR